MTNKPHGLTGKKNALKERKKDGRLAGRAYPEIEEGAKRRAAELGLSMGDYLALLIERDLQDPKS